MDNKYWNLPLSSSGISHHGNFHVTVDNTVMYFDVSREELLELLAAYEKAASLRSLATKAGISYPALVDFKRGKSQMLGDKNLRAVMKILRPQNDGISQTVPIVGYVGAGAEVFPIDDHVKGNGFAEVECPSMLNAQKAIALEVRGESMEPLISDGFLLFYEERAYGVPAEFIGAICVVKIAEGATLVKKVRQGTKVGHYHLHSLNPNAATIENAQVEWSAKVKVMVQR